MEGAPPSLSVSTHRQTETERRLALSHCSSAPEGVCGGGEGGEGGEGVEGERSHLRLTVCARVCVSLSLSPFLPLLLSLSLSPSVCLSLSGDAARQSAREAAEAGWEEVVRNFPATRRRAHPSISSSLSLSVRLSL